jgi:cytochrome c556
MKSRVLLFTLALASAAMFVTPERSRADVASGTPSKEEAEGIIFERHNIMLQIGKDAELLGEIAAGIKPPDKLAEVTKAIADSAEAAKGAFVPNVPGGRAKPEIWTNWPDYSRRMNEFSVNAKQLAELGGKEDLTSVTNALGSALPCKECHDIYRGPKR